MTLPIETWVLPPVVTAVAPGTLAVRDSGGNPVTVGTVDRPPSHVDLHALWSAPPDADTAAIDVFARTTALSRASLLRCEVEGAGVRIVHPLFVDGATRHAFLAAALEVVRAWEILDISAAAWQAERSGADTAGQALARIDAELAPSEQAARAFEARHGSAQAFTVPAGGATAWAAPDPAAAHTALAAGTQLSVGERRGDWAQVSASNGWTGWIDARVIR